MGVQINKRPIGFVLSTSTTAVSSNIAGSVNFFKATHGLSSGDVIYIRSTVSSYNGYWYVAVTDVNNFNIAKALFSPAVEPFTVAATVTYYRTSSHYWNSVHLPMVYEFITDKWPTNAADTAQSITTFTNYNGYTYIKAGGDIKTTGTASTLEQVKLTGTSVDGVYKIVRWISDTNIVIDLPYSAGNVLSTGFVQYYYSNYAIRVKVYAGLQSGHALEVLNPMELVGDVKLIPNADGIASLNVSEMLKKKIGILENDLLLDGLPNNTDAFCQCYVSYAETYDDSNMYTVSEYTSSYTDDATYVYGLNAMMPFKNQSIGALSDYYTGPFKFLRTFEEPTLFDGKFFDVSYINRIGRGMSMRKELYLNGVFQSRSYEYIAANGIGVYRHEVSRSGTEDRIDITVCQHPTDISGLVSYTNAFNNPVSGGTANWTLGANPTITIAGTSSKALCAAFTAYSGNLYAIHVTVTTSSTSLYCGLLDASGALVSTTTKLNTGLNIATFTPTSDALFFAIFDITGGASTSTITSVDAGSDTDYSETLTINVSDDCSFQDFYLTWLNYLGGFEYWNFTARKQYNIEVTASKTQERNIFSDWPNSYGEFADSINRQTLRKGRHQIKINSQFLTTEQEDAIKLMMVSPLVQLVTSRYDRRTILIEPGTLQVRKDQDKTRTLQFTIVYTDDLPSQKL